jgi:hypothetical protein
MVKRKKAAALMRGARMETAEEKLAFLNGQADIVPRRSAGRKAQLNLAQNDFDAGADRDKRDERKGHAGKWQSFSSGWTSAMSGLRWTGLI